MTLDRAAALSWYQRNRERSRALFDMLPQDAYYERPIDLRHPIVFYDGHLPGFSFNTLVKKAAGEPGIDARLESLFARGIDPHESRAGGAALQWPGRDAVRDFVREADTRVVDTLKKKDVGNEPVFTILEHEAMHQETLLYMWHRLPFDQKKRPAGYSPVTRGSVPQQEWIEIPSGRATLGVDEGTLPFVWDNEMPAYDVDVAAFGIQKHDVTNAET